MRLSVDERRPSRHHKITFLVAESDVPAADILLLPEYQNLLLGSEYHGLSRLSEYRVTFYLGRCLLHFRLKYPVTFSTLLSFSLLVLMLCRIFAFIRVISTSLFVCSCPMKRI